MSGWWNHAVTNGDLVSYAIGVFLVFFGDAVRQRWKRKHVKRRQS